jgi:arylsulfatase A-like enzyme
MKAIMLMFDSLNRHMLSAYGSEESFTPNFQRLRERSVQFEHAYVGSMPCMPARRELHTGRYNFLHRGWGSLEPYDESMPQLLKDHGIHTHIATDHYHYFEDGGQHYLQRYRSYEMFRGQEGDLWKGAVADPELPPLIRGRGHDLYARQDEINRRHVRREEEWPMHRSVTAGLEFLEVNRTEDDWFLQIETFDPHEPFYAPPRYRNRYDEMVAERADWPPYGRIDYYGHSPEEILQIRREYLALLSFCDAQLGRVLDYLDAHDMWDDTMLIVNTDHGFLLGEKDLLGKGIVPFYNEIANIPLFIWDPRCRRAGTTCASLVQTIDLPPTLLAYFGANVPDTMQGEDLATAIGHDASVHDAALFGMHGGHLNLVTSEGLIYMLAPDLEVPLYSYSLDFTTMRGFVDEDALRAAETVGPFPFTRGMKLMKFPAGRWQTPAGVEEVDMLFDVRRDPLQERPFADPAVEQELKARAAALLGASAAPAEQYLRYGLPQRSAN